MEFENKVSFFCKIEQKEYYIISMLILVSTGIIDFKIMILIFNYSNLPFTIFYIESVLSVMDRGNIDLIQNVYTFNSNQNTLTLH